MSLSADGNTNTASENAAGAFTIRRKLTGIIDMKYEQIFTFAETNKPREGMTISETLFMSREEHATIFSFAEGTDIGEEYYPHPYLYLSLMGETGINAEKELLIPAGSAALIPARTPFGVFAQTPCIFLEIEVKEGFNMNLIKTDEVFALKDLLPYEEGKIVNADIVNNSHLKLALMSFDAGCATPEHAAGGNALLLCLEGEGVITNEGIPHTVHQGESFSFRPGAMHKVSANTRFKMMIMIVKE